ncbi:carboxypeptidase regulatory-like domain-containing protein [uncultured Sphingomonas sp.]|uniref:TonB-dependent receptor n=1 Tax=uncultured Sphingomonas sp. TaxID=158754 RepID=UPI00258C090D|nr:carboxypeptidase regulatory-like domain-containing protein [uncultured Sphingomonas sp.]
MRNNLFVGVAAVALIAPAAAMAQETTSTIRGTVTSNGAPVAGATVTVTHVPSGTRSTSSTDATGNFSVTGLRVGGPFTVEVASASGNTTVTDIFTVVQQPFDLPIELAGNGVDTGTDIVITASSIRGAGVTSDGPQTVLTAQDIRRVASVNRDVRDLARRDPLATLDLSNSRAVSFGGVNPRFNRFTINGVQVGDNFGLNSDANPTGRGPIPFDAIAQFSVSIAPYDVRQGNFQGGAIDTVLKSGTNSFSGTGFYSQSRDEWQGKKIGTTNFPVPDYNSETYGATLSGPIIADKLFFMVSAERNTDPRPLSPGAISQVPNLTQGQIDTISGIARDVYGYDPGGVVSVNRQKDEKIVGRIDWNVADGQRLSLSYINAFESSTVLQNSSTSATTPSLGLQSNAYQRSVLLRAGIAQLNSDWTDNFSTEARFLYKSNAVAQRPLNGLGFAQFRVCTDATSTIDAASNDTVSTCGTGNPVVAFGPDVNRQANDLFFDTWGGSLQARYNAGDHDVRIFTEIMANRTYNLFQAATAGAYYFDSIADFRNRSASQLQYANAVSLNTQDVAANFRYQQYTFGAQDEWKLSDTLTMTYGARYDLYAMRSPVARNDSFFARNGFYNTQTYKGLDNFQPRISLNWTGVPGLRVRGGVGVFGGGSPDIYLSNSYSNTGVLSNQISNIVRANAGFAPGAAAGSRVTTSCNAPYNTATGTPAPTTVCTDALNNVSGTTIPGSVNQYLSTATSALRTAPVAALDPDFRLPSVTKATLSADYRLFGFNLGADYIFTKTNQAVVFTDLRSRVIGTLPDGRPRYDFRPTPGVTGQTADTNTDILLTNTSRGRSHIAVVRFDKQFDWGLYFGGSYARQDVKDVSPATSSTPTSNYANAAVNDPNFAVYGVSNDQVAWSFKYNLGFDHAFFGDYKTTIALFGETRAGRPYSYTMQNGNGRSPVFGVIGQQGTSFGTNSDSRYLLYVPTGTTDPLVSYDSADTQTALDTLINNTKLKDYRGKIAAKNIARSRAFTRIDLHVEQELPTGVGGSRVSLFADIENLPNLINSDWGGLRQLGFPQTAPVVQVSCLAAATANGAAGTVANSPTQACAQYRYSSYRAPNDVALSTSNSLYLIRIGARFSF